jgi:predicted amidohydrolase
VISDGGEVTARYDKRFLGGTDPDHYSPGSHFSTWTIDGIRCGALICYDYRFPELYRHYVTLDVQLMFHSFHAANASPERVATIGAAIGTQHAPLNPAATLTYPGITMPAVMTASAACNNVWISCPNSSAPQSMWPAFFVRSDGITIGRLERNIAGVLISAVDTEQDLYDSTGPWRRRAIAGVLHSGNWPRTIARGLHLDPRFVVGDLPAVEESQPFRTVRAVRVGPPGGIATTDPVNGHPKADLRQRRDCAWLS